MEPGSNELFADDNISKISLLYTYMDWDFPNSLSAY